MVKLQYRNQIGNYLIYFKGLNATGSFSIFLCKSMCGHVSLCAINNTDTAVSPPKALVLDTL